MRLLFYILFISTLFISCSSDNEMQEMGEAQEKQEGNQIFSIEFKEIAAKNLSDKSLENLVPAFVLISVSDDKGSAILNREKIAISLVNEKYISSEITLEVGSYSLTEFIVIDENNVAIALAPKANSVLSQFIENSLPLDFTVDTNEATVTPIENIEANGYTSIDFGYSQLDVMLPESTDFFTLTIEESTIITPKTIVLKSIAASSYVVDWGDGIIEEYLSTMNVDSEENELTHLYAKEDVYNVTITGAIETIEEFRFYSNDDGGSPLQSNIISADIAKLILLKKCHIYSGKLSTLNTSSNTILETLELGYNQITSLDVTNNPGLKTAWLRYNQLTEFDVSKNSALEFLWLTGNQISNLDLSNNIALESVFVRENKLTSCNVTSNTNLSTIDLSDNFITSMDFSNNTNLLEVNVGANELTSIDLSKNTDLVRIDLYNNQIADIDLSFNSKLKALYIPRNALSTIDVSNNPEIERLIIENNNLSSLDITNNLKIFDLEIGGNQFNGDQLDQIITHVYDQAVLNLTMNGYIDFKNNPGFNDILQTTTDKINDLQETYMWSFNNNNIISINKEGLDRRVLPCGQTLSGKI